MLLIRIGLWLIVTLSFNFSFLTGEGVVSIGKVKDLSVEGIPGTTIINSVLFVTVQSGDFNLHLSGPALDGLSAQWKSAFPEQKGTAKKGKGFNTQDNLLASQPFKSTNVIEEEEIKNSHQDFGHDSAKLEVDNSIVSLSEVSDLTANQNKRKPTTRPRTDKEVESLEEGVNAVICTEVPTLKRKLAGGGLETLLNKTKVPSKVGFMNGESKSLIRRSLENVNYETLFLGPSAIENLDILNAHHVNQSSCKQILMIDGLGFRTCQRNPLKRLKRELASYNAYKKAQDWTQIGKCDDSEYQVRVDPSKACTSWHDWVFSNDFSKVCTFGIACSRKEFYKSGVCEDIPEGVDVTSICSLSIFNIAPIAPAHQSIILESDDEFVCSIGNRIIKACNSFRTEKRMISYVGYNGQTYIVSKKHHFTKLPDLKDIRNYICTGCSEDDCDKCDGDETFLENFRSKKPIATCKCLKAITLPYSAISMHIDGNSFNLAFRFTKRMNVSVAETTSLAPSGFCHDCDLTCSGSNLIFKGTEKRIDWVRICVSTFCESLKPSSKIEIPFGLLAVTKRLQVWMGSETLSETFFSKVDCLRSTDCDLISCWICASRLYNPSCYNILDYTIIVFIVIGLTCLITLALRSLQLVSLIMKLLLSIFSLVLSSIRFIIRISLRLAGKSVKQSRTMFRNLEEFAKDEEQGLLEVPVRTTRARATRGQFMLVLALLFLVLASEPVESCSKIATYKFEEDDCKIMGNQQICETKTKLQLFLGTLETDSCFSVKMGDRPVGSIHFKLTDLRLRCVEELLYWVFEPRPYVKKSCHCWGSGLCRNDECFPHSLTDNQMKDLGYNSTEAIGIHGCQPVSSELFSSCVGAAGCCLYHTGYKPHDLSSVYKVSKCSSTYFEAAVTIKMKLSAEPESISNLILVAGFHQTILGTKVSFSNPSIPWKPDYSNCIVSKVNSSETFMAKCNDKSEQIAGRIGEIKCPSLNSVGANLSSCSSASDLIDVYPRIDEISFRHKAAGISNMLRYGKLPKVSPEFTATKDSKGVLFSKSFSDTLILHIELPKMKIQQFSDQSECTLAFSNMHGCHSCVEGAVLNMKSNCNEYPSIGLLKCEFLEHDVPLVASSEGPFSVKISIKIPNPDSNCTWNLGKSKGSFIMAGTLLSVTYSENNLLNIDTEGRLLNDTAMYTVSWSERLKGYGVAFWRWPIFWHIIGSAFGLFLVYLALIAFVRWRANKTMLESTKRT